MGWRRSKITVLHHRCLQVCGFSCCLPLFVSVTEVINLSPLICFLFFCLFAYHCYVFAAKGCELQHKLAVLTGQGLYPVPEDLILPPPLDGHPCGQVVLGVALMLGLGDKWGPPLFLAPKGYPELHLGWGESLPRKGAELYKGDVLSGDNSLCCAGGKDRTEGEGVGLCPTLFSSITYPQRNTNFYLSKTDIEMSKEQEITFSFTFLMTLKTISKIPNEIEYKNEEKLWTFLV